MINKRNTQIDELGKAFMRTIAMQVRIQKNVYKYLTFESGKLMLENSNIQFTRASKLNDSIDCHIDKVDYSAILHNIGLEHNNEIIVEKLRKEAEYFNSIAVCSLGKSAYNDTLWRRYTRTDGKENGICIELDTNTTVEHFINEDNIKYGFVALPVRYVPNVEHSIKRDYLLAGGNFNLVFWSKLVSTKLASVWEKEEEMRFVLINGIGDKEYFREVIPTSCITKVILGKDINYRQAEAIEHIIKEKYCGVPSIEYRQ